MSESNNTLRSVIYFLFRACFFCIIGCNNNRVRITEKNLSTLSIQYSLDDLIRITKYKFNIVDKDGKINANYGELRCTNLGAHTFEFTVGCGSCGDIIEVIIQKNQFKDNTFDIFNPKGKKYFGEILQVDKQIGELVIISDTEIRGNLHYCVNKESGCCGDGDFILRKAGQDAATIGRLTNIPEYASKASSNCINCALYKGEFSDIMSEDSTKTELIGIFIENGLLVEINNDNAILKFVSTRNGKDKFIGYRVDRYQNNELVFELTTMEANATGFREGIAEVFKNGIVIQRLNVGEVSLYESTSNSTSNNNSNPPNSNSSAYNTGGTSSNSHSSITFDDDQSVYIYLSGKTFYSANRSARVSIDNVVHINGEDAYYNLTIRKLSSSVGVVKGQSMNNPDGTITIYVYPQRGCITNSGDEFCISK